MYAIIDGARYACNAYVTGQGLARVELLGDEPAPQTPTTIQVYLDDDSLLGSHSSEDYEQVSVLGNVLAFHDGAVDLSPPADETVEAEPPTPTIQDAMLDMLADLDYRLGLMELAAMAAQHTEEE